MKKFKLTWDERVTDHDDDFLYMEKKSQTIEAENEDAACDQWNKENEHNEYQNGLSDCIEVVESELFKKHLLIDMPDGFVYAIPVEIIARNHAEYYANKEYNSDIAESLRNDTLPLFEDISEIHDWASNNMNWSDVKKHAITLKKKISESEFQDAWVNGEWKVA